MGNVPICNPARVEYDEDFHMALVLQEQPFGSQEQAFLQVHLEDRAHRCLLEQKLVREALIEQAKELLRREGALPAARDEKKDDEKDDAFDEVNSIVETVASTPSSAFRNRIQRVFSTDSGFAPKSVVTSFSTATQPTGNRKNFGRKKSVLLPPPQIRGENIFDQATDAEHYISNALQMPPVSEHDADMCSPEGFTSTLCHTVIMPLLHPELSSFEPQGATQVMMIRDHHAAVLHLKLRPNCVQYFQRHLTRLLPDNVITRVVERSIGRTCLSPKRRMDSKRDPTLDVVDFGVGPPSAPITLLTTGSSFLDLGLTGSLGLVDRKRPAVMSPVRGRSIPAPSRYTVLMNRRSGIPIAVCALKKNGAANMAPGPPSMRIFATKRRLYAQRPTATTKTLGLAWSKDLPLYAWAEVVSEGRYPDRVRYFIFLATGVEGRFEDRPSYVAVHETADSPEIRVVGRTERERQPVGCAVLQLCTDADAVDEEDVYFRISVSRGIDPALLLCLGAFVDESLEKAMRTQCQTVQEAVYQTPHRVGVHGS